MTLAQQIAERIHALRHEDLSPLALRWNSHAFIDTIGCALAGMAEEAPRILLRLPGVADGPGPATVWATDRRTGVLDAALVNGTASHALDYDDVSGVMGGHPSAMLVPSMIALGESLDSNGRDLGQAYVVGYETVCRIARAVHFHHYDKGWHPTATLGVFGTVAAAWKKSAASERRADRRRAWPRGVIRIGPEGEFRHDDKTFACRPCLTRRIVRRVPCARGIYRQCRRVRAQARVPRCVQRARHVRHHETVAPMV